MTTTDPKAAPHDEEAAAREPTLGEQDDEAWVSLGYRSAVRDICKWLRDGDAWQRPASRLADEIEARFGSQTR